MGLLNLFSKNLISWSSFALSGEAHTAQDSNSGCNINLADIAVNRHMTDALTSSNKDRGYGGLGETFDSGETVAMVVIISFRHKVDNIAALGIVAA